VTGLSLLWQRFRYSQLFLGAQRNAFRPCDALQQSTLRVHQSAQLTHSGNPRGFASLAAWHVEVSTVRNRLSFVRDFVVSEFPIAGVAELAE
jgi:hypothetical protein